MPADTEEPTECGTCRSSLERGYSSIYDAYGNLKRVVCFDCARTERQQAFAETGVLTTGLMTDVCIDKARGRPTEASRQVARIQQRAREFERRVWFGGLREHLATHQERGESLEHLGLRMLTFVMAGRVMITLEDADASVTLITLDEKDDTPRMGIQGICATEAQAVRLIERAEAAWASGARTEPDREVRIAGM